MSNLTNRAASRASGPNFIDAQRALPNEDGSPNILRFGDGLMLWVTPRQKMWRTKVYRDGKSSTLNLGAFPEVSIKEAKAKSAAIKVAADPAQARRKELLAAAEAAVTTFRLVATEWIETLSIKEGWTRQHRTAVEQRLALHVFPVWGDRPIAEIVAPEVRKLVTTLYQGTKTTKAKPAVAVAVKQYISRIFDFAWSEDRVPFNPAKKVGVYLPARRRGKEQHQAHVKTIEDARAVLAAVEARAKFASPWTLLAHRLIALTGARKTEALAARWDEFDLDAGVWTIPEERMKGRDGARQAHVVALSPQAIDVVRAARRIKENDFVFAASGKNGNRGEGRVSRCTVNTLMARALADAGLTRANKLTGEREPVMVPHGWRGTFSTIMNEVDEGISFRIIDVMLAHKSFRDSVEGETRKSSVEGHYNHAQYRSARHRIACQWADMLLPPGSSLSAFQLIGLDPVVEAKREPETLDELRAKAFGNVVPLRRGRAA